MNEKSKNKWNNIYSEVEIGGQSVSKILQENSHLLPTSGNALDLACGTGSDAIFLASQGLVVDAWDISDAVIQKLDDYAKVNNLSIKAKARDISEQSPRENSYDVIAVAHFLDRKIIPVLVESLRPDGLIFYQTFSQEVTPSYSGPKNLDFRLGENELLQLFSDLHLVAYREEGLIGDIEQGFRNEVMLIGQKK